MAKKLMKAKKYNDCWNTIGVWSSAPEKCERLLQEVHCRNCDVFSRAGREVLERNPPGGYVTQWRKDIAEKIVKSDPGLTGVITFRLGNEWFAISAISLQEVAELRKIHRVPHNVNPHIAGIVNIGGEIDICYSLGNLLGVEKGGNQERSYQRLMVLNYQGHRYIFPVSEVSGMTRYGDADIVSAPSTLGSEKSSFINDIILFDRKHIAVLNVDQVCNGLVRNAL